VSTARNAPCPCGSGRKFKQCCMQQSVEGHLTQASKTVSVTETLFCYQGILQELRYIRQLARSGDARMISYAPLFFFSTDTGDAWLLDTEDQLAACVMMDYEPIDINISSNLAISWPGSYQLQDNLFVYRDANGKTTMYWGYPTKALMEAIRKKW